MTGAIERRGELAYLRLTRGEQDPRELGFIDLVLAVRHGTCHNLDEVLAERLVSGGIRASSLPLRDLVALRSRMEDQPKFVLASLLADRELAIRIASGRVELRRISRKQLLAVRSILRAVASVPRARRPFELDQAPAAADEIDAELVGRRGNGEADLCEPPTMTELRGRWALAICGLASIVESGRGRTPAELTAQVEAQLGPYADRQLVDAYTGTIAIPVVLSELQMLRCALSCHGPTVALQWIAQFVVDPDRCGCGETDVMTPTSAVHAWAHENHRLVNRATSEVVAERPNGVGRLRRALRADLRAPERVLAGNLYGPICERGFAGRLRDHFLRSQPDPSWIADKQRA